MSQETLSEVKMHSTETPASENDTTTTYTLEEIHHLLAQVYSMTLTLSERQAKHAGNRLMDVKDVSEYLNVSVRTVENLIASGELVPLRIRGTRRFSKEGVDAYLRSVARKDQ